MLVSLGGCLELLVQLRQNLEEVPNEAVVRDFEDGRVSVLVDGHDHLRVLHTRYVLDGTGDSDGEVNVGGDDLASLAHLKLIGNHAGVDSCSGGSNGALTRAQGLSNVVEHLEVFVGLERSAPADHVLGSGEISHFRLGHDVFDESSLGLVNDFGELCGLLDGVVVLGASLGHLLEVGVSDGEQLDFVDGGDGAEGVSGVDGPHELGASLLNLNHISDGLQVEKATDSRHQVLAEAGGGSDDIVVSLLLNQLLRDQGKGFGVWVVELVVLGHEDLVETGELLHLAQLRGHRLLAAVHEHVNFRILHLLSSPKAASQRGLVQLSLEMLGQH
mmetsp:Transcript_11136/g.18687  ORF Transcript_11136/g.18687 Transcript_11136/m.18687 type:complete len:330 (-) Transcript_11136:124-1113(-)